MWLATEIRIFIFPQYTSTININKQNEYANHFTPTSSLYIHVPELDYDDIWHFPPLITAAPKPNRIKLKAKRRVSIM